MYTLESRGMQHIYLLEVCRFWNRDSKLQINVITGNAVTNINRESKSKSENKEVSYKNMSKYTDQSEGIRIKGLSLKPRLKYFSILKYLL